MRAARSETQGERRGGGEEATWASKSRRVDQDPMNPSFFCGGGGGFKSLLSTFFFSLFDPSSMIQERILAGSVAAATMPARWRIEREEGEMTPTEMRASLDFSLSSHPRTIMMIGGARPPPSTPAVCIAAVEVDAADGTCESLHSLRSFFKCLNPPFK